MSNIPFGMIFLYPFAVVINEAKDLVKRKFITHETRHEMKVRRNAEMWSWTRRYLYIDKEGCKWKRGELGQFDDWEDFVHKHVAVITGHGTRYDGGVKNKTIGYWAEDKFNAVWELAK